MKSIEKEKKITRKDKHSFKFQRKLDSVTAHAMSYYSHYSILKLTDCVRGNKQTQIKFIDNLLNRLFPSISINEIYSVERFQF